MQKYPWDHTDTGLSLDLLSQHLNPIFIETGTNTGCGVARAIASGFSKIISIDIEKYYIDKACLNFNKILYKNIDFQFYCGNSPTILKQILPQIDKRITFWLDGHSPNSIPLIDELEAIGEHTVKDHTILIDDMRMIGSQMWNFLQKDVLIEKIMSINNNFTISYYDTYNAKDDILIAKII